MALYSKKEFATLCGIPTKDLSNYIRRSNVVLNLAGEIDTTDPKNRAFMQKRNAKLDHLAEVQPEKESPAANGRARQAVSQPVNDTTTTDSGGIPSIFVSEAKYKHHLAVKTERAAELDRLKIEKMKGVVVPSEPIIPIFLQHNQHILQEQKNADEENLTYLAHKYDISAEDMGFIRGEWLKRRNAAVQKATDATKKAIPALINDYSERRGVGQRD